MSGIVGSRLNIRGSGLVGSLGTDGQVFTSSGAGAGAVYEAAAAGGKILQVQNATFSTETSTTGQTLVVTEVLDQITPSASSSKIFVMCNFICTAVESSGTGVRVFVEIDRQIDGGGYSGVYQNESNYSIQHQITGFDEAYSTATPITLTYTDAPSTTNAVDYAVYFSIPSNNDAGDTITTGGSALDSSITLMEIDGS
jgi:hypothetical protein